MKVLIYMSESDLKPIWWPCWYLYNLKYWLSKTNDKSIDISFLPKKENIIKWGSLSSIIDKLKKYAFIKMIINYAYVFKLMISKETKSQVDFSEFDIIHFHTTFQYYMCRKILRWYKWKVILTSHSPMPFFKELLSGLWIKSNFIKNLLEKIDIYAFYNADYILFPCEEAEECYYNQWDIYQKIHEDNKDKYLYLPTWLIPINIKESKQQLREKYKLKKDDFVLCYVWRHNEVKWYGSLKKIWSRYLKNNDAFFLIAWKEEPLKGLNNDRWIEIWWTNKPYEIIKCSDVFILPNKETYFDLILLEVLSLWKPIVLTRTWGNKYFEKFKNSWLFFYDYDNYEQFNLIFKKLSEENLDELWNKNKKIFDENFNSDKFANNYISMYKSLLKNK